MRLIVKEYSKETAPVVSSNGRASFGFEGGGDGWV